MIKKGKRQEIKIMNQICVTEFLHPSYQSVRQYLFLEGYSKNIYSYLTLCSPRTLSSREYDAMCVIVAGIVSMNSKKPHNTVVKITHSMLERLAQDLHQGSLSKKQCKAYED